MEETDYSVKRRDVETEDIPGVRPGGGGGFEEPVCLDRQESVMEGYQDASCWKKTLEFRGDDGNFRWAGDWRCKKTPVQGAVRRPTRDKHAALDASWSGQATAGRK
jgi:hypothetical protein